MKNLPLTTFIGGGNMARAILNGLLRGGMERSKLLVVDPNADARAQLAKDLGVATAASATQPAPVDSLIVWAVKPQAFAEASHIAESRHALHLSVMAGVSIQTIMRATSAQKIIRAMPNTPALIGQGITGLYALPDVSATQREQVQTLLQATGSVFWVDSEPQLDAVTAISGSGPAYVFAFMEALADAAQGMGLDAALARHMVQATVQGAAALAAQSPQPIATLRQQVTSKGGTTAAALEVFQDQRLAAIINQAAQAAQRRSRALGQELEQTIVSSPGQSAPQEPAA